MTRVARPIEWTEGGDEESDAALGPEDYAWMAVVHDGRLARRLARLPELPWIWDSSNHDLTRHLISLAALRPMGSA